MACHDPINDSMELCPKLLPRVCPGCVLCPRIDPLRFLAGCRSRRLNWGLVVVLVFFSLLHRACFSVIFSVCGCMLCLVHYFFVISTSVIDCLGRFVPKMTCYVSSRTLNLTKPNHQPLCGVVSKVTDDGLLQLCSVDDNEVT